MADMSIQDDEGWQYPLSEITSWRYNYHTKTVSFMTRADGERLHVITKCHGDPIENQMSKTIIAVIAAEPGTLLLDTSADDDGVIRTHAEPCIAWAVCADGIVRPCGLEGPDEDHPVEFPSGAVQFAYDCWWPNRTEYEADPRHIEAAEQRKAKAKVVGT